MSGEQGSQAAPQCSSVSQRAQAPSPLSVLQYSPAAQWSSSLHSAQWPEKQCGLGSAHGAQEGPQRSARSQVAQAPSTQVVPPSQGLPHTPQLSFDCGSQVPSQQRSPAAQGRSHPPQCATD